MGAQVYSNTRTQGFNSCVYLRRYSMLFKNLALWSCSASCIAVESSSSHCKYAAKLVTFCRLCKACLICSVFKHSEYVMEGSKVQPSQMCMYTNGRVGCGNNRAACCCKFRIVSTKVAGLGVTSKINFPRNVLPNLEKAQTYFLLPLKELGFPKHVWSASMLPTFKTCKFLSTFQKNISTCYMFETSIRNALLHVIIRANLPSTLIILFLATCVVPVGSV